jgi:predicted phage baseplate assembly protein
MIQPCGCCAGIEIVTPESEANRPGLPALAYRAGTYATFFETMLARLSNLCLEVPSSDGTRTVAIYPLRELATRQSSDPSIALLDAWAIVADVLTFYQERIANEGYLNTATERRSILELARLVGYKPRPGVASSVYLAFTVANGFQGEIPAGTRAQSIPGTGEKPQFFETSENLAARDVWNNLRPRLTQPQVITLNANANTDASSRAALYFQGTSSNLKTGDPLLIVLGDSPGQQVLRFVVSVDLQANQNRTKVILQAPAQQAAMPVAGGPASAARTPLGNLFDILGRLALPASLQPASSIRLQRTVAQAFASEADTAPRLLAAFKPAVATTLYTAWAGIQAPPSQVKIYAMRTKASLFGSNAPLKMILDGHGNIVRTEDWPVFEPPVDERPQPPEAAPEQPPQPPLISHEEPNFINLDSSYEKILPASWIVVQTPTSRFTNQATLYAKAVDPVAGIARGDYGMSGKTTVIELGDPVDTTQHLTWFQPPGPRDFPRNNRPPDDDFKAIRQTLVYAQPEELSLAEEPLAQDVEGNTIELDGPYDGLESGRWIIVSGERTDIPNTTGVTASELVMIAGVNQSSGGGQDPIHTSIVLAQPLAYKYATSTLTLSTNVVKATHGQTVAEVLGNGDASQVFQKFALHQSPLTYLPASSAAGAQSTLKVLVNDIEWHEAANLPALGATDRGYITKTDDADQTFVIFGNGEHGARPPTGNVNIKAVYRYGIGQPGNVKAQQISQLATHPLGVQGVVNPLPATGGADRDSANQARRNVPLAVKALDRLVSVEDYADFARTFAGIGKASAIRLSDGRRQLVHVTIAGADDIPIDQNSDLYQKLVEALHQNGDPYQPIQVCVRKVKLLVISAGIRMLPDYQWEAQEPKIRAALLDAFSFDNRELGQSAFLSEAVGLIQSVEGVAYVDVQKFDGVPEDITADQLSGLAGTLTLQSLVRANLAMPDRSADPGKPCQRIPPAEIVFLTPDIPDTLILTEISG